MTTAVEERILSADEIRELLVRQRLYALVARRGGNLESAWSSADDAGFTADSIQRQLEKAIPTLGGLEFKAPHYSDEFVLALADRSYGLRGLLFVRENVIDACSQSTGDIVVQSPVDYMT